MACAPRNLRKSPAIAPEAAARAYKPLAMDNARTAAGVTEQITQARGTPVVRTDSAEVAAFAMQPRDALGDAAIEWSVLDRAVHAMEARDWPAAIVAISSASLAAPSFAYRLRDLAERHGLDPRRIWLEVDSPSAALALRGVVGTLAIRHAVGCRIDGDHALDERVLIPDLANAGVSFTWLHPGDGITVADDLSALIGGRSLVRRARTHGLMVIGPAELGTDLMPPIGP